jgi:hypothetical protein
MPGNAIEMRARVVMGSRGDAGSPALRGLKRTTREKQISIPKLVMLVTYKVTGKQASTKGILIDANDTVQVCALVCVCDHEQGVTHVRA